MSQPCSLLFLSVVSLLSFLPACGGGTTSSETYVETGTTSTDTISSTTVPTDPCEPYCGSLPADELQASCETLAPGSVLMQCQDVVPDTCQLLPTLGPVTCADGSPSVPVCCAP